MITIGGKEWKSLSNKIFIGKKQVKAVYYGNKKIYPTGGKYGRYEIRCFLPDGVIYPDSGNYFVSDGTLYYGSYIKASDEIFDHFTSVEYRTFNLGWDTIVYHDGELSNDEINSIKQYHYVELNNDIVACSDPEWRQEHEYPSTSLHIHSPYIIHEDYFYLGGHSDNRDTTTTIEGYVSVSDDAILIMGT